MFPLFCLYFCINFQNSFVFMFMSMGLEISAWFSKVCFYFELVNNFRFFVSFLFNIFFLLTNFGRFPFIFASLSERTILLVFFNSIWYVIV